MKLEERSKLTFWTFFTAEVIFLLVAFLSCFAIFLYFIRKVFLEKNQEFDNAVFQWTAEHRSLWFTELLEFITFFGSKNFFMIVPPILIGFFLFFRRWQWFSVYILVGTFGSSLLNQLLKAAFERARPSTAFYFQHGYSFPSGHAMIGTTFYGVLAYLIWRNVSDLWLKRCLVAALILWELIIAYSRVYLNVHFASDVLAGIAAGFIWLLLTILLLRQLRMHFIRRSENNIQGK